MSSANGRVLWVATADARGHVMRAQLLCRELTRQGVEVDVVTTSDEGAAFLAAFGVKAEILSRHYRVEFDRGHNMARARTDARIARYILDPTRMLRDLRWLARRADGADLVVNDSNHPALLGAPFLPGTRRLRVVHVYGRNLRQAVEDNFEGRAPRWFSRTYAAAIRRLFAKGFARIEHSFEGDDDAVPDRDATYHVLPVIEAPIRDAIAARAILGIEPSERLAVVYLNPHFRDEAMASAIEEKLATSGFKMHAIGEGYAHRPGWRPHDPHLADAVAAADLYVSSAGMAALGQARAFGTPFLCLATDQPEQRRNLQYLQKAPHAFEVVDGNDVAGSFGSRMTEAVRRLTRPPGTALARSSGREAIMRTQSMWVRTLLQLVERAQGESGRARASAVTKENSRWRAA